MVLEAASTPRGLAKSGRDWKKVQTKRFSSMKRSGILEHMAKSFEEKKDIQEKRDVAKTLEKQMADATKEKKEELKRKRIERQQRRQANEYKSSSFQMVIEVFS